MPLGPGSRTPVRSRNSIGLKRRGLQPRLVSSDCLLRGFDKAYNPARVTNVRVRLRSQRNSSFGHCDYLLWSRNSSWLSRKGEFPVVGYFAGLPFLLSSSHAQFWPCSGRFEVVV